MTQSIGNLEILPPHFTIYRQDRPTRGGDTLLVVFDTISSSLFLQSSSSELIVVRLVTFPNLYLCCAYIPPHIPLSVINKVFNCLKLIPQTSHILFLGDFKMPDVNWTTQTAVSEERIHSCDLTDSLNLVQLIHESTHIKGNILDLVFSNFPDKISNIDVDSNLCPALSDHYIIYLDILISSKFYHQPHLPETSWCYQKTNFASLSDHLSDIL